MSSTEEKILVAAPAAAKMLDMGKSTFWQHVREGKLPQPVRIDGITRWRVADLRHLAVIPAAAPTAKATFPRRPRSVPLGPGVTHLYRHFDASGQLLYVGVSLSAIARLGEHRAASHWFWQIARIDVTAYASRKSAEKAERITIQREKPLHNITHARKSA